MEILGFLSGLLYLYLEIRQRNGMWIVGLVTAIAYCAVYLQEGVYASMGFQIYYVLISIYGFFHWRRNKSIGKNACSGQNNAPDRVVYRKMPLKVFLLSIAVFAVATVGLVALLSKFTNDPMPLADSAITVLSAIATFWLSKLYMEQWYAWMAVNAVTVFMSLNLQLYPTAILYFLYIVAAFYGYFHWKRNGILLN